MDKCPKCGGTSIIPDVTVIDQMGHYIRLGINVYEHPDAVLFKGTHTRNLRTRLCGSCGYLENYVDNPGELYEIYETAQQEKQARGGGAPDPDR